MSYPWDFETEATVRIDAEEILDYVKENREWFLERLNTSTQRDEIVEICKRLQDFLDKWDMYRVIRDMQSEEREFGPVKMWDDINTLLNDIIKGNQ